MNQESGIRNYGLGGGLFKSIIPYFLFLILTIAIVPYPAQAQLVTEVGPLTQTIVGKEIKLGFMQQILASAIVGLVNVVQQFAQQAAYDLATGLATGCKGEGACAFVKEPGAYLQNAGWSAAGEFIGSLHGPWEELGMNLCGPRIPSVGLSISLGLAERFQPPKPKCDFRDIARNWENFSREATSGTTLLSKVSASFEPGQSDLGQAVGASNTLINKILQEKEAKLAERLEGGGVKAVKDILTGNVKTPATVLQAQFQSLPTQGKENTVKLGDLMTLANAQDMGVALIRTVASTFTNTLASRMLKTLMSGLFKPSDEALPDLTQLAGGAPEKPSGATLNPAFVDLLTPQIRTLDKFDYLSELSACPQTPTNVTLEATLWNCSLDDKFAAGILQASSDQPLTVAQAVEQKYLDRAKPFAFLNPDTGDEPRPGQGYAYSALKKLRFMRIIPVGWEMAAFEIKKSGKPATLGDVLDGWNNPNSPFFGLVDPNWVLKAPAAQCGALTWSSLLDSSKTGRQESCTDVRHCVLEESGGGCNAYGYCTREKNFWDFDGDSCEAQYASCDTFKAFSGEETTLLENTVDFGSCDAGNAGCTRYAPAQTPDGEGKLQWSVTSPWLYLDRDAPKCAQKDEGCLEFLSGGSVNLIQNPGFESGEGSVLEGWVLTNVTWSSDSAQAYEGKRALAFPGDSIAIQRAKQTTVPLQAGLSYTVSWQVKRAPQTSGVMDFKLRVFDASGLNVVPITEVSSLCSLQAGGIYTVFPPLPTGEYQQRSCTFVAPQGGAKAEIDLGGSGASIFVDAVQLEVGQAPTDFHEGVSSTAQKTYLKAPPDYLGCTGEPGERTECVTNYARVCRREEVGCEEYRPANGDPAVPAVASALDRCDFECVGYNTYIKQSSTFEPKFGGEGMYMIIPQNSRQCDAASAGCEEFTNLANEQRQYFTSLRACQKPDPTTDKTYFTWEGSDTTGYQLKSWVLKKSNNSEAPCTQYAIAVVDGQTRVNCTDPDLQEACTISTDNPDCRAFYNDAGTIFNRLLSRTIISTEECTSYRWTGLPTLPEVQNADRAALEQAACTHGHGFWNATTNQCLYLGAPTLSNSCTIQSNGCRGFSGNAGANVQVALTESFEGSIGPVDLNNDGDTTDPGEQGWTGGTLSSEALTVQQHSLKVVGESASRTIADENANGKTFLVNFLAKGAVNTELEVKIGDESFGTVKLTPSWQTFALGPATATAANPLLAFTRTAGPGPFFIDEVTLKAVTDTVYLVKNSWDIPPACDTLPAEAGSGYLRGAQLGCSEYRDRAGVSQYFKSFSSLCRPQSVGCQDLIDTRNSEAIGAQEFNTTNSGICRASGDNSCRLDTNGDGVINAADEIVCAVPSDKTFCTYGSGIANTDSNIALDDWNVGSDRHRFLVVDPKMTCPAAQKGCQKLGQRDTSGLWQDVWLRNDPQRYSTDLCQFEDEGCDSWSRKDKSVAYFKAPQGGACEWRANVAIGPTLYSGWFRKDKQPIGETDSEVNTKGRCSGFGVWDSTLGAGACKDREIGTTLCRKGTGETLEELPCTSEYCTKGVGGTWQANASGVGGTCLADTPCYGAVRVNINGNERTLGVHLSSHLVSGNTFGIWRNADAKYAGRVGLCPKEQATCTEFRDPTAKTSPDDPGQAYYFKDNERLKQARAGCPKGASRKAGCVLFNNTEILAKNWQAEATYAKSETQGGDPVQPESRGINNDVNTLLKVKRDRACAEWFQCASAQFQRDPQSGKWKSVCFAQERCNVALPTAEQTGALANCGNWVPQVWADTAPQITKEDCVKITGEPAKWIADQGRCALNQTQCQTNPLFGGIWHADDPDGTGPLLGHCESGWLTSQPYRVRDRSFAGLEYTGYSIPMALALNQVQEVNVGTDDDPNYQLVYVVPGTECHLDNSNPPKWVGCTGGSFCAKSIKQCVRDPRFDLASVPDDQSKAPLGCRGYPDRDAPFPNTEAVRADGLYSEAPLCQSGQKCECAYKKVDYGGQAVYFAPDKQEVPASRCVDGEKNGQECGSKASREACQDGGGTCRGKTKTKNALGWRGYCLDQDISREINGLGSGQKPCLTWWPIDQLPSQGSAFNQFAQTAYLPDPDNTWYCLGESRRTLVTSKKPIDPSLSDFVRIEAGPEIEIGSFNYDDYFNPVTLADGATNKFTDCEGHFSYDYYIKPKWQFYRYALAAIQVEMGGCYTGVTNEYLAGPAQGFVVNTKKEDIYGNSGVTNMNFRVEPVWDNSDNPQLARFRGLNVQASLSAYKKIHAVKLIFKPGCTSVVQTMSNKGETRAWTGRVIGGESAIGASVKGKQGTGCPPWGHIGAGSPNFITSPNGTKSYTVSIEESESKCLQGTGLSQLEQSSAFPSLGLPGLFAAAYDRQDFPLKLGCPIVGTCSESANDCLEPSCCLDDDCGIKNRCFGVSSYPPCEKLSDCANPCIPLYLSDTNPWQYVRATEEAPTAPIWDITGLAPSLTAVQTPHAPRVNPIDSCSSEGECTRKATVSNAISVNRASVGDVLGFGGNLEANVQFAAETSANTMPIRNIKIQWGDGKVDIVGKGYYRNYLGVGGCDGTGFGRKAGETCIEDLYNFGHNYACEKNGIGWQNGSACTFDEFRIKHGGCCVFQPKVQVIDNWEYCNGSGCGDATSPGGDRCYKDECKSLTGNGWAQFAGRIVMEPKK